MTNKELFDEVYGLLKNAHEKTELLFERLTWGNYKGDAVHLRSQISEVLAGLDEWKVRG